MDYWWFYFFLVFLVILGWLFQFAELIFLNAFFALICFL
jgi:hypothetical protein